MKQTYTLSFHQGGDMARYGHNTRTNRQTGNPDIDPKKKHLNITLINEGTTKDAYQLLFQDAVDKYNSKQKNKDRIITNYHSKIQADPKKHLCYEVIVQIGSIKEGFPPNSKELLSKYVDDFQKKNPNLHVYGAFLHLDEKGGVHLHLDYIPFYHCKRGLELKTSLTGALGEMGFKTYCKGDIVPDEIAFRFMTQENEDYSSFLVNENNQLIYNGKKKLTAQIQWEQGQRDNIRELCNQNNISLKKQGVGHKKYFTVQEYKELQEELTIINSKISELQSVLINLDTSKRLKQEDYETLTKKIDELHQKSYELEKYNSEWQQIISENLKKNSKIISERDKLLDEMENNGFIEKTALDILWEEYPDIYKDCEKKSLDRIEQEYLSAEFEYDINTQDTEDFEL